MLTIKPALHHKRKNGGFTLIELMITLALAGILTMVAAPSFSTMIKNNRQTTQTNTLVGALNIARSEAIKRQVDVVICRSSNGTSCLTTAGDWEQGWLIYADNNDNGVLNAGTDEVLRVYGILSGGNKLVSNSFTNKITYLSSGFITTLGGTFILCDDRDGDGDINDGDDYANGYAVIISSTGRARSDTASNSIITSCDPG